MALLPTSLVAHNRLVPVVLDEDEDYRAYLQALPPEKRKRIQTSNDRMRTGLHAVAPLTCPGPGDCKFIHHCPIPDRSPEGKILAGPVSNYPVGRPCVMEALYMRAKIEEYFAHLEVSVDNPVEVALVNELALLDLYKNRALMVMSAGDAGGQGQALTRTDVIGIAPDSGIKLTTTQLHPAFMAIEALERRRLALLERLVQTRKSQVDAQAKLGVKEDQSQIHSDLVAVRELLLTLSKGETEIKLS